MRLEWKYTLIVNVFILATMSIFFIINDRIVKKESVLLVIRDYFKGAAMREIATDIQERINGKRDAYELEKAIMSTDLNRMELAIVDINVMDPEGVVIASLTGKALNERLDRDGLQQVMSKQTRVQYPPKGYYGKWVIEYTLPYIRSTPSEADTELGILQIMFSAQGIASDSQHLRMRYLIYITVVTVVLTIFIVPFTGYLIVRRLERLMETITAAEAGDLAARAKDSSEDEIGRLGRSFNRMVDRIRSEHASRLRALGNLAAGVAHEVRNPLNSIAMTIQYLKETIDAGSDGEAQECLDVISRQVKELDSIVEDFIQLTRPAEMNWQMVNLNTFLDDVMLGFASSLEIANVKLIRKYSEGPLYAKIDSDKLRQALSNIIINSIQAMPDGGELQIATAWNASENNIVIEINDTGIGISQADLDRLFEPYFTTKPDGTGLGLAITYRIIEAHNGEISVTSEEGQGATFTILINTATRT